MCAGFDQLYKEYRSLWGKGPNELLKKVWERFGKHSTILDLGTGQGRDALFLAKQGFRVVAIDIAKEGLKTLRQEVGNQGLASNIQVFQKDIADVRIRRDQYMVVNAYNVLHFLVKKKALRLLRDIKNNLKHGGYLVLSNFTTKDPRSWSKGRKGRAFFRPKELATMFFDWNIVYYRELKKRDKAHPGRPRPHIHGIVSMIARKL